MQGLNFHLLPLKSPTCWQMGTINSENKLELLQPSSRVYHGSPPPSPAPPACTATQFAPLTLSPSSLQTSHARRILQSCSPGQPATGTRILLRRDCSTALPKNTSWRPQEEVPWRNLVPTHKRRQPIEAPQATNHACPYQQRPHSEFWLHEPH